jgi:hypothetical protein
VASGPASDLPRRHGLNGLVRRAGGVVRGFAARRLAVHRLLRPRRLAAPVGADVVGALPVRPPWTALTWMRLHATPSTVVGSTMDTRPGRVVRPPRRAGSAAPAPAMRRGRQSQPGAPGTPVHALPSTIARRRAGTGPRAGAGAPAAGPFGAAGSSGVAGPLAAAGPCGAFGAAGPFGIGLLDGGLPSGRLFGPAGLAADPGTALGPALGGPAAFGSVSAAAGPAGSGTASSGRLGAGSIGSGTVHHGHAGAGSIHSGRPGLIPGSAAAAARRRGPGASARAGLAAARTLAGATGSGAAGSGSAGLSATGSGSAAAPPGRTGVAARGLASPVQRLATAPVAGPSVSAPVPAASLPVLGGSSAPIAAPDPSGAVSTTPPPASPIGAAASRSELTRTPRERWEAAVAARPLENPRPLPSAFHAMAREITGRAYTPRFTTGPATRQALAAAGALGATTGTVVHLPGTPTTAPSSMQVLAHELTHTRSPVRRPRFFLGGLTSHLDDDERGALAAGRRMLGGAVPSGPTVGSGLPSGLPVAPGGIPTSIPSSIPGGGSLPGAGSLPSLPSVPSLPSAGNLPGLGSLPTAASMASGVPGASALSGLSGLPGSAGAAARNAVDDSSAVGAGLVGQLPVGGGVGAVADMAQTTARQTVLAAMPGGQLPDFSGAAGDASAWAQGAAGGLAGQAESAAGGLAGDAMGAASGAAGDASPWAQGAFGQAQGAAQGVAADLGAGAQNVVGQAQGAAQGAAGQVQNVVGGAAGGAGGANAGVDPDKIVEMVEQRLLREIERRGGRWAGVF